MFKYSIILCLAQLDEKNWQYLDKIHQSVWNSFNQIFSWQFDNNLIRHSTMNINQKWEKINEVLTHIWCPRLTQFGCGAFMNVAWRIRLNRLSFKTLPPKHLNSTKPTIQRTLFLSPCKLVNFFTYKTKNTTIFMLNFF